MYPIPSYGLMKDVWEKLYFLLLSPTFTDSVQKTLNHLVLRVTTKFKWDDTEIKNVDQKL